MSQEPTSDEKFIQTFVVVIAVMALFAITIFVLAQILAAQEETMGSAERISIAQNMSGDSAVWTDPNKKAPVEVVTKPPKPLSKIILSCGSCHRGGTNGAPKFGAKDAWSARLKERGIEGLVTNAIKGYKGMPARGTQDIDDAQVRAAVVKILADAGAQ